MTVILQTTTAGADTGPFSLYSNLDNYTIPFETGISKASLLAGYTSSLVPDYTTKVKIVSTGNCKTSITIILASPPPIPCGSTTTSGGVGITNNFVYLLPTGGYIIFGVDGQSVPDKFEIIHNGIKKATSGMTGLNAGPFDNVYGTPPINTIPPDSPSVSTIDQFIGSSKGTVPNRNAVFLAETGISYITATPQQQLVWWHYTSTDYSINPQAVIRVTGTSGTSWSTGRKCETTTTTTTLP